MLHMWWKHYWFATLFIKIQTTISCFVTYRIFILELAHYALSVINSKSKGDWIIVTRIFTSGSRWSWKVRLCLATFNSARTSTTTLRKRGWFCFESWQDTHKKRKSQAMKGVIPRVFVRSGSILTTTPIELFGCLLSPYSPKLNLSGITVLRNGSLTSYGA